MTTQDNQKEQSAQKAAITDQDGHCSDLLLWLLDSSDKEGIPKLPDNQQPHQDTE